MALSKQTPTAPAATHQEFTDPALKMAVRIPSPPPLLDELNRLLSDPKSSMEGIGVAKEGLYEFEEEITDRAGGH